MAGRPSLRQLPARELEDAVGHARDLAGMCGDHEDASGPRRLFAQQLEDADAVGNRLTPVGSSASKTGLPVATARAMATRCCSPPESSCGKWSARSARPTRSSVRRRVVTAAGAPGQRAGRTRSFSRAVRAGKRLNVWKMKPTERLAAEPEQLSPCRARDVTTADDDATRRGPVERADQVQERRLAAAGRAQDDGELAGATVSETVGERDDLGAADHVETASRRSSAIAGLTATAYEALMPVKRRVREPRRSSGNCCPPRTRPTRNFLVGEDPFESIRGFPGCQEHEDRRSDPAQEDLMGVTPADRRRTADPSSR